MWIARLLSTSLRSNSVNGGVNDFSQIARLVKHVLISRAPPPRPKKSISRTHPRESGEGSEEARYLGGSVVRLSPDRKRAWNPASCSNLKQKQSMILVPLQGFGFPSAGVECKLIWFLNCCRKKNREILSSTGRTK